MRLLFIAIQLIFSLSVFAQTTPVTWNFKLSKTETETYLLTATATIEDSWGLYSQHTEEGGPVPTTFAYEGVETVGETLELSEVISKYSDLFEIEVKKFKNKAVFTQEFKPKSGSSMLTAKVSYMCCDDKKCLPPTEVSFDLAL